MPDHPNARPDGSDALDAARDFVAGERDLASALRAIRDDADRASETYRGVVRSLATALAARDGYTGSHSDIVHDLAVEVAMRLGLDEDGVDEVRSVAILHDIGKIGIPDGVLHKPGLLTDDEWELMRTHPIVGERILEPLAGFDGIARAVRHEHERWDGHGYPDGLAGEEIPQASRIVLACDAFHALVSDRPYRPALGREGAIAELHAGAGTQFDPAVVDSLVDILAEGALGQTSVVEKSAGPAQRTYRVEREARALLAIASAGVNTETLPELLGIIADEACAAADATSIHIARLEADARQLRIDVNAGRLGPGVERHPPNDRYHLDVDDPRREKLLAGEIIHVDLHSGPGYGRIRDVLAELGLQRCVLVPVALGRVIWGDMLVTRSATQPEFDEADVRFLSAVAGQVGAAVGRMELFARMADLAFRDPLTGVGNRRAFDERLELAVRDALDRGSELTLLLCDLDNLKELNETGGHPAGDEALSSVAGVLSQEAEPFPVYRLGGDEFAVLLEGAAADEGRQRGERVLAGLRGISVSCGVAELGNFTHAADLLRAADHAQYAAKRGGRARVCVAMADSALAWPDRDPSVTRQRRRGRRAAVDVARLLERTLAALDGPLLGAGALERLEAVVAVAAPALDLARSAISRIGDGSQVLDVVATNDYRGGAMWSLKLGGYADVYRVAEFPTTARTVREEGSFFVHTADEAADPTEVGLLEEWGLDAVLATAARGESVTWLIELYADGRSAWLADAEAALRLVVAEAVRRAAPLRSDALAA